MNWDNPVRGVPLILAVGLALGIAYNALHVRPMSWVTQARAAVNLKDLQPAAGDTAPPINGGSPGSLESGGGGDANASSNTASDAQTPAVDTYGIPESRFPINVDLADAKTFFDRGIRVFDARDPEEFAEGHIQGALSTPYDTFGADPDWLEATAADPHPILIYCGGGDCETSLNLGFAINQAGHSRVLVYEGGFPEWEKAGYPVSRGEER